MIIPFINQKLLISDTSQREITRVTQLLRENDMEFYEKTASASGAIATNRLMDAKAARVTNYNSTTNSVSMVYIVYVKRKDFERAKTLITKNVGMRL